MRREREREREKEMRRGREREDIAVVNKLNLGWDFNLQEKS